MTARQRLGPLWGGALLLGILSSSSSAWAISLDEAVRHGLASHPSVAAAQAELAAAGTDVAIESAGIVLASDDPRSVVSVRHLSARSYRKMRQNLVWAAGYNVAAIPLAAGVLAWAGFVLPMSVGAALMSLSTIIVALNAQLLRTTDLRLQPTSAG